MNAVGEPAVRAVGDAALLRSVADHREARALADAVRAAAWSGVLEVVSGLRSVLVVVDPCLADPDALAGPLGALQARGASRQAPSTVVAASVFDGPDLEEVTRLAGCTADEVVGSLTDATLEVAFLGFSPGFAYLVGLPPLLGGVPRRETPRRSVPAGSLAIGGGFAAIYPQRTPGGWQLIGRSALRLFQPESPPYALLRPGDIVRVAGASQLADQPDAGERRPKERSSWHLFTGATSVFSVGDPGTLTTIQDAGRPGVAHLGVPAGGPADPVAHALANRLVGNAQACAALEVTARGPSLRCTGPAHLAVVGDVPVLVNGLPVETGRVVPVEAGQQLDVGAVRSGLRAYLAVAGGFRAPKVLGSLASDMLSGLGPGPLIAGDELGAERPPQSMGGHLAGGDGGLGPPPGVGSNRPWTLRVLSGPHREWFAPDALDRAASVLWTVTPESDRVGLRLAPAGGDSRVPRRQGELDSQGMVTGAVQVPPSGEPVVLGPDHATVGGYPVLAVVATADRWMLGQCRPGDQVQLMPVSAADAAAARQALERSMANAIVGHYPVVAG